MCIVFYRSLFYLWLFVVILHCRILSAACFRQLPVVMFNAHHYSRPHTCIASLLKHIRWIHEHTQLDNMLRFKCTNHRRHTDFHIPFSLCILWNFYSKYTDTLRWAVHRMFEHCKRAANGMTLNTLPFIHYCRCICKTNVPHIYNQIQWQQQWIKNGNHTYTNIHEHLIWSRLDLADNRTRITSETHYIHTFKIFYFTNNTATVRF